MLVTTQALGLDELLGRDVHAGDRPLRADRQGGHEGVHARAAAQVQHALAGDEVRETEVVAHPGERAHRGGRQPVEHAGGVAQRLGETATRVEVQVVNGLVGDVAVHLGDVAGELVGVDAGSGVRLRAMATWSWQGSLRVSMS